MIAIWMKIRLVSDSNYNVVTLHPPKISKEWLVMLGWHLVLVKLHRILQLVLSKAIWIGDTKYLRLV
jgi:hypothetical protein